MIETERQGYFALFMLTLPYLVITSLYAAVFFFAEEVVGDHIYKISGQIGSVFGLAIAFFTGFRMNSAYDRWWEARKIWGELTNNSRSFAAKVYVYFGNTNNLQPGFRGSESALIVEMLDLELAYVAQFKRETLEGTAAGANVTDPRLKGHDIDFGNKVSNEILLAMTKKIESAMQTERQLEKNNLMQHIDRFYEIQGKSERIQNTPFLKIYSALTFIMVSSYVILLPLFIGDLDIGGEDSKMEAIAIPIVALVSTSFLTINKLANCFGEPFSARKTSVNVVKIAKTIESNIKEVRGKC
jgi:ion channel-forming bestrophin family protein